MVLYNARVIHRGYIDTQSHRGIPYRHQTWERYNNHSPGEEELEATKTSYRVMAAFLRHKKLAFSGEHCASPRISAQRLQSDWLLSMKLINPFSLNLGIILSGYVIPQLPPCPACLHQKISNTNGNIPFARHRSASWHRILSRSPHH